MSRWIRQQTSHPPRRAHPVLRPRISPITGRRYSSSGEPSVDERHAFCRLDCADYHLTASAQNGTYKRVKTFGNELGFTAASGGQTVYYLSNGKVTAFKPGFRMTVGNPSFRTAAELNAKYKMMDYTCLASSMTRGGATTNFPTSPCKAGIMVSIRFPTCWYVHLYSPQVFLRHLLNAEKGRKKLGLPGPPKPRSLPIRFFMPSHSPRHYPASILRNLLGHPSVQ